MFILVPSWDLIPGRLYHDHLCRVEAGVKVFNSVTDTDTTAGNQDKLVLATTINPLDLVLWRQTNDFANRDPRHDGFSDGEELVSQPDRESP